MEGSGDFSIGSTVWPGTGKVIEEAGELTKVLGKLIAASGRPLHWDEGEPLNVRARNEIADLYAALDFWITANLNVAEMDELQVRRVHKLGLFLQWDAGIIDD